MAIRLFMLLFGSLLLAAAGDAAASARVDGLDENRLKALYVYRFIEYVQWRGQDEQSPVVIGVLAAEEVTSELEQVVAAHRGRVRKVVSLQTGSSIARVNVLYIGRSENGRLDQHLRNTAGILTITDSAAGLDAGAVINLVSLENRVRFEVSLPTAERNGLVLSSRLLSVALRVKKSMLEYESAPRYTALTPTIARP
jgi:hypothetical protein